jgi:hypothetical protein
LEAVNKFDEPRLSAASTARGSYSQPSPLLHLRCRSKHPRRRRPSTRAAPADDLSLTRGRSLRSNPRAPSALPKLEADCSPGAHKASAYSAAGKVRPTSPCLRDRDSCCKARSGSRCGGPASRAKGWKLRFIVLFLGETGNPEGGEAEAEPRRAASAQGPSPARRAREKRVRKGAWLRKPDTVAVESVGPVGDGFVRPCSWSYGATIGD